MDLKYEVITPQTLQKYVLKALSYGDEIELQSAIMTSEASVSKHFNEILYKHLVEKPKEITSFQDFLSKTTIADRVALVAGLYHLSYGDEYITDTICPYCGSKNSSKITLSNFGSVQFYPGKPFEILDKTWDIELPISKQKCKLKVPTLDHEQYVMEQSDMYSIPTNISNLLLYIRSLEFENQELQNTQDSIVDLVTAIKILRPKDVRHIKKVIQDEISQYTFDIKYKVKCQNKKCNKEYIQTLDFVEQFLRSVIEA